MALAALARGELIAFPTDTVYGVGARAFDVQAVARLYPAKGRPESKPIPILIGEAADLALVSQDPGPWAELLARRFWPGPLTLVVWRHAEVPEAVSAGPTVGVRVPDLEITRRLLQQSGPLAVTSANRSGDPPACTAKEAYEALVGRIALLLDGGATPGGRASTVVDCSREPPRVLRPGPIDESTLFEQAPGAR
jgi:L-threonylcarbamoyladenylate synthase